MNLILVGLSHKTADIALRELLAFNGELLPESLFKLSNHAEIDELVILSTCNRVEITAAVKHTQAGFDAIVGFLVNTFNLKSDDLIPHLYFYSSSDAVKHIFMVASSLDSLVVGEAQILGQVKAAFDTALQHKSSGVLLNKVFKKAISVAKRVRTETAISENPVSVSSVAVELAVKIFGSLEGKTVFVVGAGEMAELALKHLQGKGVSDIVITTRNFQKAVRLAGEFNGRAVKFETFTNDMSCADIVICSTGAPHYIIRPAETEMLIENRQNRPVFMIDISVPRNIDPAVNKLDNLFLYDVDDLNQIVQENMDERLSEARGAELLVDGEVDSIFRWIKSLDVVPTIVAIRQKGERIRQAELEKTLARLDGLSAEHKKAIEMLASSIINKILHAPMIALKQEAERPDSGLYIESARKLFNLDDELTGHRKGRKGCKDHNRPASACKENKLDSVETDTGKQLDEMPAKWLP